MLSTHSMSEQNPKLGGARPGAGRKPRKSAAARGIKPATAAEILDRADERRKWYRLLNSQDDAIVLRALMYLTDRRDGKPAQQVYITSQNITLNAGDLEKARAIVREIRGELFAPNTLTPVHEGDLKVGDPPAYALIGAARGETT